MALTSETATRACRRLLGVVGPDLASEFGRRTGYDFDLELRRKPEQLLDELLRIVDDLYVKPARMALEVLGSLKRYGANRAELQYSDSSAVELDASLASVLLDMSQRFEKLREILGYPSLMTDSDSHED